MWFQNPPLGTQLDWNNHLNKGVVMHLAMNEGHGDKVQDLSMNGNHGTLKNMAFPPTVDSGWNPGQTGVGLKFDGTDDYVNCENNNSLNITDAISISALVKFDTFPAYSTMIQKTGSGRWDLYAGIILAGNDIRFWVNSWDNNFAHYNNLVINTWYHVVGTYDKNAGVIRIYVNGIEGTPDAYAGDITYTTDDLIIGITGDLSSHILNGAIDQPRIHNRALSAKEVMDYYINPWQVYLDEDD